MDLSYKDLVPEDAEVGDDTKFACCGNLDRNGLGFSVGHAHVFNDRLPLAAGVFDLQVRRDETAFALLRASQERAAVRPIHPSIQHQDSLRGAGSKIEIERMQ